MGDPRQKMGDRTWETEHGGQKMGDRRRGTEDGRQKILETRGKRQEMGDGGQ